MVFNALAKDYRIKLVRPDNISNHIIYKSDFNDIYDKYFKDFVLDGTYSAAPSGVLTSFSEACEFIPSMYIANDKITNYIIDDNYMSVDLRECGYTIMCERDAKTIDFDSVTISPSVSHATGVLLIMMKNMGIEDFYCVAPAYFSIIEQALYLGFNVHLLHGTYDNEYYFDIDFFIDQLPDNKPYILSLFSPRYPLGDNINYMYLQKLLEKVNNKAYIIIDEAQDRSFPSVLRSVEEDTSANIFRVFGPFKSLGLHGAKAAMIKHHPKYRIKITEISETIGGTLDKYSAMVLSHFSRQIDLYIEAIKCAGYQISCNYSLLTKIMDENVISSLRVENGFLGAIIVDIESTSYQEFRHRLLCACRNNKMPLAIGTTQFFPYDGSKELIRINYYQRQIDFEKSILILNKCLQVALSDGYSFDA